MSVGRGGKIALFGCVWADLGLEVIVDGAQVMQWLYHSRLQFAVTNAGRVLNDLQICEKLCG